MPRPYSSDLRTRVLAALKNSSEPREEIARRFQLAPATLYNWQRQEREEGRTQAKPHNGGPRSTFDAEVLRRAVAEKNDRTIAELQVCYQERTGRPIGWSSVRRLLVKLGLTRKKKDGSRR